MKMFSKIIGIALGLTVVMMGQALLQAQRKGQGAVTVHQLFKNAADSARHLLERNVPVTKNNKTKAAQVYAILDVVAKNAQGVERFTKKVKIAADLADQLSAKFDLKSFVSDEELRPGTITR
jgi:hypothetical protein